MTSLLERALACHDAGLAVVPIAPDGQKRPAVPWAAYQNALPTREQVTAWFTSIDTDGLGIVTGAGSGHLEMYEAEGRALSLVTDLANLMRDHGQGDLWDTLNRGWVESTPSGGLHWHYRISDGKAARNTKLARRPATADELEANPADKIKVLIETRGQGGFTVISPSAGRTHPTGNPWRPIIGGPDTIPTITVEQRDTLYAITAMLDAAPTPEPIPAAVALPGQSDGLRPGDDYNRRATWDDILTPRGWTRTRRFGDGYGWTRPGKDARDGISATTNTRDGADRLYVFSTSTEFDDQKPYSKFAAYTLLEHGGDWRAAAAELRRQGYGDQPPPISPEASWTTPTENATATTTGGNGSTPSSGPESSTTSASDASAADASQTSPSTMLRVIDGTAALSLPRDTLRAIADKHGPTEDGTARALAEAHHDKLRYCPQRGSWLTWTGARWEWDQRETHREHVRAIARALPEDDGWKAYKKRALSATGVAGIARLAQSDPAFVVHIDDLDANPYEINTPGGIIDLRTGLMRPPDPHALHTRSTAVAPDYERDSETWQDFLTVTFGDNPDLIGYVQRLVGLSAIGTVLEQILPFAHGSGANGKSTLAETAMHVLGRGETGYAISAPSEMLMVRRHSEHPAELAQLAGARLVICSELEDGARFAEARVKQLTGRDSVNARFMRRDPFTFTPSHTMWLLGNHKPETAVGGPAFWRRVQLIPFENVVPVEKRDPHLGEKLEAEAPAVLAWIARGAADYLASGLRTPDTVTVATQDYAHDQDTVGRFVEEQCHLVGRTAIKSVRDAYEKWCAEEGSEPVSARRLTQELRAFGVETSKSGSVRHYQGIGLVSHDDDSSDGDRGGW